MRKDALFSILIASSFFAYAEKPFMSCGDGEYFLSTCVEGYVCINGREPLTQKVNYLNEQKRWLCDDCYLTAFQNHYGSVGEKTGKTTTLHLRLS